MGSRPTNTKVSQSSTLSSNIASHQQPFFQLSWESRCYAILRICLLFQKDHNGKTACEYYYAFERYGKEETFNMLGDLIPTDAPAFSILHHVAKHAPQYIDDFVIRYPSSMHTRDYFGRTVSQIKIQEVLASGTKTYENNSSFFLRFSYEDSRTIDPKRSGLYTFMNKNK